MRVRTALIAGFAAAASFMAAAPLPVAHAATSTSLAVATGTASLGCFGCGQQNTGGTFSGHVTGVVDGTTVVNAAFSASFSYSELNTAKPTCVIAGTANGSITGALTASFSWTRVGAFALVTVTFTASGNNATAVAAFAVTSPLGNPCHGPVTAKVVAVLLP